MGKTMIMKRFRDEHPPSFNSLTGTLKTPVLAMEMTSRPGERRFYAELLTLLGAPQRPRADIAQMEQAALRILEAIGVQVLVIDEVHNILAGSYRERNSQAGHPNCGAHSTVLILRPFAAAKGLEGCSLAAAGRPRPSRRPLRGLLEA